MNPQAGLLAGLFEKSLNLNSEWTVVDIEFREVEGHKDELHIYIERTPGRNISCTVSMIRESANGDTLTFGSIRPSSTVKSLALNVASTE